MAQGLNSLQSVPSSSTEFTATGTEPSSNPMLARGEVSPKFYRPNDRIGTPDGEMVFDGIGDDGYYYVSGRTIPGETTKRSYRVPPHLHSADEIRAWVIRQVNAGNIDQRCLFPLKPEKQNPHEANPRIPGTNLNVGGVLRQVGDDLQNVPIPLLNITPKQVVQFVQSPQPQIDRILRPYGDAKPWKGELGGAQLTATPIAIQGKQITWRIDIERGGQKLGSFETKFSGQLGAAQFKEGSPLKKQVMGVVSQHKPQPTNSLNILDRAIVSSTNSGQPVRVRIPVDGEDYHRIMGNNINSPANPVLDMFIIAAPAKLQAEVSHKPTIGQALSGLGVTPLSSDRGGGAVYAIPNTREGGQLYAKALQSADHQPFFGGNKTKIPSGASEAFIKGFNEANAGATTINWLNAVNTIVMMLGMIPVRNRSIRSDSVQPTSKPKPTNEGPTIDMVKNQKTGVYEPNFQINNAGNGGANSGEVRPTHTQTRPSRTSQAQQTPLRPAQTPKIPLINPEHENKTGETGNPNQLPGISPIPGASVGEEIKRPDSTPYHERPKTGNTEQNQPGKLIVNQVDSTTGVQLGGIHLSKADIFDLSRAPSDSTVRVSIEHISNANMYRVRIEAANALFTKNAISELIFSETGSYIINRNINLQPGSAKGTGLSLLFIQAKAAQKLGFKNIISEAYSDGTGQYVGPYVWGRYGFDAPLSKKILGELGLNGTAINRVSDLFSDNVLREVWKKYVVDHSIELTMSLDVTPGSQGMMRLEQAYFERSENSGKGSNKLNTVGQANDANNSNPKPQTEKMPGSIQPTQNILSAPVYQETFQKFPELYDKLSKLTMQGYEFIQLPGKDVDGVYPGLHKIVITSGLTENGQPMHPNDIEFSLRQSVRNVNKVEHLFQEVKSENVDAAYPPTLLKANPEILKADVQRRVAYLTPTQLEQFSVRIADGKLIKNDGTPLNTSDMRTQIGKNTGMIVIHADGSIYVTSGFNFMPGAGLLRDTSLSGGKEVIYSGAIGTDSQGRITLLSDYSESYEPNLDATKNVLRWLKAKGIDIDRIGLSRIYARH